MATAGKVLEQVDKISNTAIGFLLVGGILLVGNGSFQINLYMKLPDDKKQDPTSKAAMGLGATQIVVGLIMFGIAIATLVYKSGFLKTMSK